MYPLLKEPRKVINYPGSSGIIRKSDDTSYLRQINNTAAEIFQLCNGTNSITSISKTLSEKYQEDFTDILKIVEEFIYISCLNQDIDMVDKTEERKIISCGSSEFWVPTVVSIELTYKCPLFCEHCYRECSMKRTEKIDMDLIKNIASEMKKEGILYVQLTGGDPLYHPQFEEIVEEFIKNDIVITLLTSGFYISENIFNFFEKNRNSIAGVQVSIDGLSNTHNNIRGRKDAYDRSINFIRKLTELEYNIDVVTTLINQPKEEVFDLSFLLKELGVKRHRLAVLIDAGRSIKNGINSNKDKKNIVDNWIAELGNLVEDDNFKVQLEEDHNFHSENHCGAGFKLIRIDPSGFIHPCLMIDLPMYSLKDGSIKEYSEKYSNKFSTVAMPSKDSCQGCALVENCQGCIAEGLINHSLVNKCTWYDKEWIKTESFY